jgi:SdpI/YfhL protein family
MGKLRRNFWAGIRTPWTFASDVAWERTHRLVIRVDRLVRRDYELYPWVAPLGIDGSTIHHRNSAGSLLLFELPTLHS